MVGRQLPFFSLIVPFWLIWAFRRLARHDRVWPAILVCGVSFAVPQFLISNFINPWIVDIGASLVSMACLIGFLKFWQPKEIWTSPALAQPRRFRGDHAASRRRPDRSRAPRRYGRRSCPGSSSARSCLIWGTGAFKAFVNPFATWNYPVPELHNMINKVPPVARASRRRKARCSLSPGSPTRARGC